MKKVLIVIDMQNDFINGPLGTPEAQAIVPNVKNKIEEYRNRGDEIIFTRDTHTDNYLKTNEGKHLPVEHCIAGTDGWRYDCNLSAGATAADFCHLDPWGRFVCALHHHLSAQRLA